MSLHSTKTQCFLKPIPISSPLTPLFSYVQKAAQVWERTGDVDENMIINYLTDGRCKTASCKEFETSPNEWLYFVTCNADRRAKYVPVTSIISQLSSLQCSRRVHWGVQRASAIILFVITLFARDGSRRKVAGLSVHNTDMRVSGYSVLLRSIGIAVLQCKNKPR